MAHQLVFTGTERTDAPNELLHYYWWRLHKVISDCQFVLGCLFLIALHEWMANTCHLYELNTVLVSSNLPELLWIDRTK